MGNSSLLCLCLYPHNCATLLWEIIRCPVSFSADGDLTDTLSCPRSVTSELNTSRASARSPTQQRHNPFNEKAEALSSTETTPLHSASQEKADLAATEGTDQSESCTELEVIRCVWPSSGKRRPVQQPLEQVWLPRPMRQQFFRTLSYPAPRAQLGGSKVRQSPTVIWQMGAKRSKKGRYCCE